MVVIPVVHRQLLQILASECASAASANPGIKFKRLGAVVFLALFSAAPGFGDNSVKLGSVGSLVYWHGISGI
jgi:hypothetical protein